MELLSGAEMVVRSLRDEGVKYIYGYPGGALLHIYDALFKEHDVTHILVRHEQAATHMADGYARATGKPGVVLVTSGPGATNAITGIATAYMDSIPMVILSGQVPSNMVGTDAFQETDMVGISRPIVKHSFIIKHPSEIPEVIKKAFYLAQSGRPGPVVVDIPKDMGDPTQKFEYSYPKKVKLRSYSPAVRGHSGQIRKAAEMLLAAKRPVVYSGGGVIMGNAAAPLTELAQMLNLPVTNTLMGLGGYPGADRQFLGMLGMHGSFTANLAMHHSDVILAVGARFDDRVINGAAKFCPNAKIIHIDIDPASISKTIKADIPIVGPVDSVLTEMVAIVREIGETPNQDAQAAWWKQIDEWRGNRGLFPYDKGDGSIIKPQTVIETLYEVTHGDAFITSDVGQHQMFASQYYKFNKPNRWIELRRSRHHGLRLPGGDGHQAQLPGRRCRLRDRRGQYPDEYPGTVYLPAVRPAGEDRQPEQWCPGHGPPVAGHAVQQPLFAFLHGIPAGLRQACRSLRACRHAHHRPEGSEAEDGGGVRHEESPVFLDIQVDASEHVYPMQIRDGAMRDMWLSKTERT